jgi:membrane associated rhomboid family serine protease
VKASHVLFGLHMVAFLVLVLGSGTLWQEEFIGAFALGEFSDLLRHPWALVTYPFLSVHPLEFVFAGGILMLVGPAVEERLGRGGLVSLYLGTAALIGLAHMTTLATGQGRGMLLGALGSSAGLLTSYLLLCGHERRVGSLPFPFVYVLVVAGVVVTAWVVHTSRTAELSLLAQELEHMAYGATNRTALERLGDLERASLVTAIQPHTWVQLLGFTLGALALAGVRSASRLAGRYRVLREISTLQEEVDARARVEFLLAKISSEGIESLSRTERRFLCYASRFYRVPQRAP